MTQSRSHEASDRSPLRGARWLAALEKELKSRVGWIDETVSPFAGRRSAQSRRKVDPQTLPTGRAA
jgi:hypothetical protein